MDIWKEVAAGIIVWAVSGTIAWLISKIPFIRDWFRQHQTAQMVALNILVSSLVSVTTVSIYERYFAPNIKISGESTIEGRIVTCPSDSFLAGWQFQDQPGLTHGALWGPSAICRKLNIAQGSNQLQR
jgi:hypothetical protein